MSSSLARELRLSTRLVPTPHLAASLDTIAAVVAANRIVAIGGPAGSGKTTAVKLFRLQTKRPCAMATMPGNPAPLDLLRFVYLALHHKRPDSRTNRFGLQNDLLEYLKVWRGILIIDELQNSQTTALQDLLWLYEESAQAFAIVAVGTTVLESVARYPQMSSRIMGSVSFAPLTGTDLLDAVQGLDPRLAQTPPKLLLRHDALACRGNLRRWVQTAAWLDDLGAPSGQPVPDTTFETISRSLPLWT